MPRKAAARRRTQRERSESTQTALLEATVRCLGRDGYAATSISSIIEEAGVSRGALLHHYPSKNELIASAIDYFYRQRLNRFKSKLLGADTDSLSLEDRLQVLREDFATWYATAMEIEVAMRTNEEVAALHREMRAVDDERMSREYEQLFPEFAAAEHPRDLVGLACYLMRGLASESGNAVTHRRFRLVVTMLRAYLDGNTPS